MGDGWRGEAPVATADERLAISAWNLLSNGSGGVDWGGLGFVCALLGVQYVEMLAWRLAAIKVHRPPQNGDAQTPARGA